MSLVVVTSQCREWCNNGCDDKKKHNNNNHNINKTRYTLRCTFHNEDRLQQLQQVQAFEAAAAAAAAQPQQEYLQQVKPPIQSQSQQQLQQTTTNINRKLNGFLNLKTPLIG